MKPTRTATTTTTIATTIRTTVTAIIPALFIGALIAQPVVAQTQVVIASGLGGDPKYTAAFSGLGSLGRSENAGSRSQLRQTVSTPRA